MKNNFIFAGIGFLISLVSMPIIIIFCKKNELYDYSDERKIHTGNIPRLGGIGIVLGFFISAVLYLVFTKEIDFWQTLPLIVAGAIIFIFGLIDDLKNLRAIIKLLAQIVAAVVVTFGGFRFKQIFNWILPLPLSYILTLGWIIGVVNAYNLIDGLDGLCGSLTFTSAITLGILYASSGNFESGICFCLAAAILGFLCFNWPPAKIFMGDSGSQFLGFIISILPLYTTTNDSFEFNKFLIMIVLTAFPVFDTIAAIWRRLRDHKPIMSPDASHLHHKFLNIGFSKVATLYTVLIFQLLVCVSVVAASYIGRPDGTILLFVTLLFLLAFFTVMHYINRAVNLGKIERLNDEQNKTALDEKKKTRAVKRMSKRGGGYKFSYFFCKTMIVKSSFCRVPSVNRSNALKTKSSLD